MQEDFQYYMHQCLDLAKNALANGNPPVGAVIVLDGEIVGTGIESENQLEILPIMQK